MNSQHAFDRKIVYIPNPISVQEGLLIAINERLLSSARRLQVGCLIVAGSYRSTGHNGTPKNWDPKCEDDNLISTYPHVLHAEAQALDRLARHGISSAYSVAYITHMPCLTCAMRLYGAGVQTVHYAKPYRDTTGLEFLVKCGINVHQFEGDICQF